MINQAKTVPTGLKKLQVAMYEMIYFNCNLAWTENCNYHMQ